MWAHRDPVGVAGEIKNVKCRKMEGARCRKHGTLVKGEVRR